MAVSPCPKCGGRLEEGYVPDRTRHGIKQATWIEGKPERSFWTGLRVHGRVQYPILTYRCSRCGLLESYAAGG